MKVCTDILKKGLNYTIWPLKIAFEIFPQNFFPNYNCQWYSYFLYAKTKNCSPIDVNSFASPHTQLKYHLNKIKNQEAS